MPTATMPELTPRMHDLIRAVETLTERRGIPPTLVEVARELHVHPSRAQQLAVDAQARGALVREPRVARSLRVAADNRPTTTSTTPRRRSK